MRRSQFIYPFNEPLHPYGNSDRREKKSIDAIFFNEVNTFPGLFDIVKFYYIVKFNYGIRPFARISFCILA